MSSIKARLDGTTWLVTGATSGIGRALALELAAKGVRLVLNGRRQAALEETASEALVRGAPTVETAPLDLAEAGAARRLHARLRELAMLPDGLVNAAGLSASGPAIEACPDRSREEIAVNVLAPLALCRLFLPEMIARSRGWVLNVASIAGWTGVPTQAQYAATKAFLLSFSQALRAELQGHGVTVTALAPGLTHTDFFRRAGIDLERRFARWGAWMSAEDVARTGLSALLKGRPLAIPSWRNRLPVLLMDHLPRSLVRAATARVMR